MAATAALMIDPYFTEVSMSIQRTWGMSVAICLGIGGCGPCGGFFDAPIYTYPISPADLHNASSVQVGGFMGGGGDYLSFTIDRSALKQDVAMVSYTLEIYGSGSACPPDPSSMLASVGPEKSSGSDSASANFDFGQPRNLQSLAGDILVLRATDAALEPVAGVVCTSALVATKTFFKCVRSD